MARFLENKYATYLVQDGILYITYRNGTIIDLTAAITIVKDRLKVQEGLAYRILCDIRGLHEINKAARDYLTLEGSTLVRAVAYLIEPTVSRAVSEFYLNINTPPIPSRAFTEMDDAKEFLEDFPD